MIRVPHPLVHRLTDLTEGFRGAIADFEKRMEKTQDERHVFKQGFPGPLRGLPTVSIHALRGIIRIDRLGFLGKDAIGLFQVGLPSRFGNRCPENTLLPRRGGDINPLAVQPTMLFVSHQIGG